MDCTKKCHLCQVHGNFIHQHPNPLHLTTISWPFERWGTYIIGPIEPLSLKGHKFILAAPNYFSKWVEAIPVREVTVDDVIKFFKEHIVYLFGVPREIRSDNGTSFRSASKWDVLPITTSCNWNTRPSIMPGLMASPRHSTRSWHDYWRLSLKTNSTGMRKWSTLCRYTVQSIIHPLNPPRTHYFFWTRGRHPTRSANSLTSNHHAK